MKLIATSGALVNTLNDLFTAVIACGILVLVFKAIHFLTRPK